MKRRAICPMCERSVLIVNGKFRSHGFSFGERPRCAGSYVSPGPGHPVTTGMADVDPVHFRLSRAERDTLDFVADARGTSGNLLAKGFTLAALKRARVPRKPHP